MAINFILKNGLNYNPTKDQFNNWSNVTKYEILRYLKGIYGSIGRFEDQFLSQLKNSNVKDLKEFFINEWDSVEPFSYVEAFNINNQEFQILVFDSVNIVEMVENLGKKHIKTNGIEVQRKTFTKDGEFDGFKEYHNIYETYEISGEKLNLNENVFAVKCWCTTTNKEHWLWIEEKYKDNPLIAIASTFRIHKYLIDNNLIKEIKRQGDILLVELIASINMSIDELLDKIKNDIRVPLTKEQYFGLLSSET